MLYYLFEYLHSNFDLIGASLFKYLSFRASMAMIFSLLISSVYGKYFINYLTKIQAKEVHRELGLEGQEQKKGVPSMGGLIIITSTLVPLLLFSKLGNNYILLLIFSMLWMGAIGFVDDYIKIFKERKAGLKGKYKIFGQVVLGVIVAMVIYMSPMNSITESKIEVENDAVKIEEKSHKKSIVTTIPFLMNNEFDYSSLITWTGLGSQWTWIIFIPIVIVIIAALSNGANLTDGMDGLAAGSSSIIVFTLGVFAWVSGNIIFSSYLNISYIPQVGEITIFIACMLGSLIGFLWYNSYPAQIFMGDTGSLTVGSLIAVIAIMIKKEFLLPLLCGVFLVENASVILQVAYFKYTKKRYGAGKRIFKMTPIHHHFQLMNINESKIVSRFWIVGVFLAVATLLILKIR